MNLNKEILLLSTSTVYGSTFLEYCLETVADHFSGMDQIVFVPFARPSGISHDDYTNVVRKALKPIGLNVVGIHELENISSELPKFRGIYCGGGNTFLLLKELYERNLMNLLKDQVEGGMMRYMGSSAGTNVAGNTINNTNDMPIVHPPSLKALKLVPFNINPHYLDPDPNSTHKGETREMRIAEFHFQSEIPVVGLREGSWLRYTEGNLSLGGNLSARMFTAGKKPIEMNSEEDFNFLMKP